MNKIISLFSLLFVLMLFSYCDTTSNYADNTQKSSAENYQLALASFKKGQEYALKKNYTQALHYFNESLKYRSDIPQTYTNRAFCYLNMGNLDKAIDDATTSINLMEKNPVAYFNRGEAYFIKKEYENAIADYTKAIEYKPTYKKAYVKRALSYLQLGQRDKANADFAKAKQLK